MAMICDRRRAAIVGALLGAAALCHESPRVAPRRAAFSVTPRIGATPTPQAGCFGHGGLRREFRRLPRYSGAAAADGEQIETGPVSASLNLAKNLVGSGILSLPSGIAAFSISATAVGPSIAMVIFAALLSAYGFLLIGRVCEETGAYTFGSAWDKSVKRGAWVPQLVCVLECLGGSIIYAMVLGDVFSSLLGGASFVPSFLAARSTVIIAIAATVLYPMCCLRSFGALAKFSLLGTMASTYVLLFVVKRCLDGSYFPGGQFFNASKWAPLLPIGSTMNLQVLILVSILSTAFLVHFNAPQMYKELKPNKEEPLTDEEKKQKLRTFSLVAVAGFGIAAVQYAGVMAFGFLTFGKLTQGNVLLNYAANDPLALAARVAVGLSTLCGYPMQFAGLRAGILEWMGVDSLPTVKHRAFTAFLLAVAVFVACAFQDLGQFQAIEGALLAAFLIYVAPPMMVLGLKPKFAEKVRLLSMMVLGLGLGAVGVVVTTCWG